MNKCDRPRGRCPFYGFACHPYAKAFVDSQGNQCAMLTASFSPCSMELAGNAPDWAGCAAFNRPQSAAVLAKVKAEFRIYPAEMRPSNPDFVPGGFGLKRAWKGIPFSEWFDARTGGGHA